MIPGQPWKNLDTCLRAVSKAKEDHAECIVLPEMVLAGYLISDMWDRPSFISDLLTAQEELIKASDSIIIAFGGIAVDQNKINEDGRIRKYNAAFLAFQKKLIRPNHKLTNYSIKTLHPNYREFDDSRYFFDTRKLSQELNQPVESLIQPHQIKINNKNLRIGLLLCEDGWHTDYNINPPEILKKHKTDLILNLSCSPFTFYKNDKRNRVFSEQAKHLGMPIVYCNNVGIQNNGKTVYTFDGDSAIYQSNGEKIISAPRFTEHTETYLLNKGSRQQIEPDSTKTLYNSIQYGTKKFLDSIGMKKVVIGISGGIDSALAAAIYSSILEPENLLLVNMPSEYNSTTTKSAAATLAQNLKCFYTVYSIQEAFELTQKEIQNLELQHLGTNTKSTLNILPHHLENIQARDRSSRILAALASCFGGGFTCNANKSETTVGYSTLYGDHAGFLANLADLWKGQVYDIANHINKTHGFTLIPQNIIDIKPAAELSDQQNPEKGQGDPFYYPYHDALFKSWVEDWNRKSPEEILTWYQQGILEENLSLPNGTLQQLFDSPSEFIHDLERWWQCYCGLGLAKRIQAPPILAVSRRAFGFDQRESQSQIHYSKKYLELKGQIL